MAEETSSWKTRSQASCSAVESSTSSVGSAAAKARGKAEAMKARLAFVEKEVALKLEQAKLEASIIKLKYEKETAAAIAEAEALESAVNLDCGKQSGKLRLDLTSLDIPARTEQYVLNQNQIQETVGQSCADGNPVKIEPKPGCKISSFQLKPEATPFLLNYIPTAFQSLHIAPQNPPVYGREVSQDVMMQHNNGPDTQYYRPSNMTVSSTVYMYKQQLEHE
ncbi:hypothetical protein ILYODFUR_021422 [Ilyodon furcidens]|uniref:Uncharacterized protein n=1 Tax=Ilyodon furcidens TaxID=33524 RepID=A0ABV0V5X9_9TELE